MAKCPISTRGMIIDMMTGIILGDDHSVDV